MDPPKVVYQMLILSKQTGRPGETPSAQPKRRFGMNRWLEAMTGRNRPDQTGQVHYVFGRCRSPNPIGGPNQAVMKHRVLGLCLLLFACSKPSGLAERAADKDVNTVAALSPGLAPVRIGEGGPGFAACGTIGTIINLSPTGEPYLPVRAAPFVEANEIARLANGARVIICTHSIDQKWQGVVFPPEQAPALDCGVSSPIARPRSYTGPCRSGWVSSYFIQLSGS